MLFMPALGHSRGRLAGQPWDHGPGVQGASGQVTVVSSSCCRDGQAWLYGSPLVNDAHTVTLLDAGRAHTTGSCTGHAWPTRRTQVAAGQLSEPYSRASKSGKEGVGHGPAPRHSIRYGLLLSLHWTGRSAGHMGAKGLG